MWCGGSVDIVQHRHHACMHTVQSFMGIMHHPWASCIIHGHHASFMHHASCMGIMGIIHEHHASFMGVMGIIHGHHIYRCLQSAIHSINAKHTTELPMATLPMAFSDRRQPTAVVGLSTVKLLYWTPGGYAQKNIGASNSQFFWRDLMGWLLLLPTHPTT